ncbi:adenylate cyclase class 2 [Methanococcus voltae]|uniref:Adenylate cyclase class 2 n=2 Tax=Methanococcus voltae TaxID=2188 RepID=A0A8J7RGI7_METVO|nr:class IV adenylate cyclase [Methanococcus voltae]MBP2201974.1 adenylate cyclase class 2 [Methanococcus voltae]MCS3922137.1 adenylate cyclase class 2 [Methanococcus voltae PS]
MIEVEIKVSLENKDIEKIIADLKDIGFKKSGIKEQIDVYYNGIDRDFRETDEALRIRRSANLNEDLSVINENTYVTYKGKKLDKISKTRVEHETAVEDIDTMDNIFKSLGFKSVEPVRKVRKLLRKVIGATEDEYIEASIDKVDNVGQYLELEITVESFEQKDEALGKLFSVLEEIGIDKNNLELKSYLELRDEKLGIN